MKITIIGIGLIGGSLAIDLKNRGFASEIVGVENKLLHCEMALQRGLIDRIEPLDKGIEAADLIVIATPINVAKELLPYILDRCGERIVTDMGSTKAGIIEIADKHPNRKRYVPSHPMAGTEYSGPSAAIPNLFDQKSAILCDVEKSDILAVETVRQMYKTLKMNVIYMDSREHDISAAYVSHISHITSFALALTVLDKEKDEKNILHLASGGFSSTVRLAKSSADMWVPIFLQNQNYVMEVIDTYVEKMKQFRNYIAQNNVNDLYGLIRDSNQIQKILK